MPYKYQEDIFMAYVTNRNGKFLIRVSLGRDENGKQIIKNTTFTPPEGTAPKKAEKLAIAFAVEFENKCNFYADYKGSMKFYELAEWYFDNYAQVELKPVTAMNYKSTYKNHIAEYLGSKKLKEINPPCLTDFLKQLHSKEKLSGASCKKIYVVVQSIFKRAVEQGFIQYNPCRNVIIPKDKNVEKKRYTLDEDETKRFINFLNNSDCDEDIKRMLIFLLFTGTRIGECLALSWDNIDFENSCININHTLANADGELYLDTPKTKKSLRTIGMSDTVRNLLLKQKNYCSELKIMLRKNYAHPEIVFPSGLGNYRDRCSVYHSLKRLTAGTEFEDMTLHKMRHCNATLLLNSGVELKFISEHLGHSSMEITASIYAEVLKSQKIKMAEILDLKLSDTECSAS